MMLRFDVLRRYVKFCGAGFCDGDGVLVFLWGLLLGALRCNTVHTRGTASVFAEVEVPGFLSETSAIRHCP